MNPAGKSYSRRNICSLISWGFEFKPAEGKKTGILQGWVGVCEWQKNCVNCLEREQCACLLRINSYLKKWRKKGTPMVTKVHWNKYKGTSTLWRKPGSWAYFHNESSLIHIIYPQVVKRSFRLLLERFNTGRYEFVITQVTIRCPSLILSEQTLYGSC